MSARLRRVLLARTGKVLLMGTWIKVGPRVRKVFGFYGVQQ